MFMGSEHRSQSNVVMSENGDIVHRHDKWEIHSETDNNRGKC